MLRNCTKRIISGKSKRFSL